MPLIVSHYKTSVQWPRGMQAFSLSHSPHTLVFPCKTPRQWARAMWTHTRTRTHQLQQVFQLFVWSSAVSVAASRTDTVDGNPVSDLVLHIGTTLVLCLKLFSASLGPIWLQQPVSFFTVHPADVATKPCHIWHIIYLFLLLLWRETPQGLIFVHTSPGRFW